MFKNLGALPLPKRSQYLNYQKKTMKIMMEYFQIKMNVFDSILIHFVTVLLQCK